MNPTDPEVPTVTSSFLTLADALRTVLLSLQNMVLGGTR